MLKVDRLTKTYTSGSRALTVLREVSFTVAEGERLSIVGPSGSGKTTLLGLCAGLDAPSGGSVHLSGIHMGSRTEDERAAVRNKYVGFVFQTFKLIPTLTALENVMVPAELRGQRGASARARELLEDVGLSDRQHHYPAQLSGGEQQRVGLARAFTNRPKILFADEPTGNLDNDTGEIIQRLLLDLNQSTGATLVIVTHDLSLAAKTDRILRLRGGEIVSDQPSVLAQTIAVPFSHV